MKRNRNTDIPPNKSISEGTELNVLVERSELCCESARYSMGLVQIAKESHLTLVGYTVILCSAFRPCTLTYKLVSRPPPACTLSSRIESVLLTFNPFPVLIKK